MVADPRARAILPWRQTSENIVDAAELALSIEFEIAPSRRRPRTGLKPAAPGCKISPLARPATAREHDEQGRHQDCDEDRDARSASAPAQSYSIQRRLYAARLRGRSPQGGVSSQ